MALYEIRRAGVTLCRSTKPDLGYDPKVLKDMERAGLHLYCDGKRKKLPPVLATRKAADQNNPPPL